MMEKLKFALFTIVILSLLGLFAYWSVVTLQSGTEHVTNQKIKKLEKENEDLKIELEKQKKEISLLQSKVTEPVVNIIKEPQPPVIYKYQSLVDELQKLVDDKVSLKEKSKGSRVGTVQKFLNIYNDTSNKVDNDYGASTKSAVATFQKNEGLSADGEAGVGTFSKMIEWLKDQG